MTVFLLPILLVLVMLPLVFAAMVVSAAAQPQRLRRELSGKRFPPKA